VRPCTRVPSWLRPSKLAPHGPPRIRGPFFGFTPPFGVYLPPVAAFAVFVAALAVAFAPAGVALTAVVAPAAAAFALTLEPLPADPTSLFVMTGTGAVVARAIVVLSSSSSPGSPGSTPATGRSARRRVVRPA